MEAAGLSGGMMWRPEGLGVLENASSPVRLQCGAPGDMAKSGAPGAGIQPGYTLEWSGLYFER